MSLIDKLIAMKKYKEPIKRWWTSKSQVVICSIDGQESTNIDSEIEQKSENALDMYEDKLPKIEKEMVSRKRRNQKDKQRKWRSQNKKIEYPSSTKRNQRMKYINLSNPLRLKIMSMI